MLIIGLTGNIGSGKTFVASVFDTLGISIFNADLEARKLYEETSVIENLREIFGDGIFTSDQDIDRQALAQIVFKDPLKLARLNELIHPLVRGKFAAWTVKKDNEPYVIYEAAILMESGHYKELDRVILVTAPEEVRIHRVIKRDGVTKELVLARMANQWEEEQKIPLADFVINNDGLQMVIPQVIRVHEQLMDLITDR